MQPTECAYSPYDEAVEQLADRIAYANASGGWVDTLSIARNVLDCIACDAGYTALFILSNEGMFLAAVCKYHKSQAIQRSQKITQTRYGHM